MLLSVTMLLTACIFDVYRAVPDIYVCFFSLFFLCFFAQCLRCLGPMADHNLSSFCCIQRQWSTAVVELPPSGGSRCARNANKTSTNNPVSTTWRGHRPKARDPLLSSTAERHHSFYLRSYSAPLMHAINTIVLRVHLIFSEALYDSHHG